MKNQSWSKSENGMWNTSTVSCYQSMFLKIFFRNFMQAVFIAQDNYCHCVLCALKFLCVFVFAYNNCWTEIPCSHFGENVINLETVENRPITSLRLKEKESHYSHTLLGEWYTVYKKTLTGNLLDADYICRILLNNRSQAK